MNKNYLYKSFILLIHVILNTIKIVNNMIIIETMAIILLEFATGAFALIGAGGDGGF
jgi:hypothetical protein